MNTKIINAFITLGLSDKESKVLSLIVERKTVMTREFERLLDMRQPEVSMALKNLQSKGWVRNGDKTKSETMIRLGNTYELTMTIDMIIEDLEKQKQNNEMEIKKAIKLLRG